MFYLFTINEIILNDFYIQNLIWTQIEYFILVILLLFDFTVILVSHDKNMQRPAQSYSKMLKLENYLKASNRKIPHRLCKYELYVEKRIKTIIFKKKHILYKIYLDWWKLKEPKSCDWWSLHPYYEWWPIVVILYWWRQLVYKMAKIINFNQINYIEIKYLLLVLYLQLILLITLMEIFYNIYWKQLLHKWRPLIEFDYLVNFYI